MSTFDSASLVMIPSGYKDQKVYSVKPTDGTGDLTFSRASSATRVASNGLIEKVRTNLLLQSNTFNAAAWVSAGPGATVTSGQSDPDSGNSAWLLSKSGTTGRIEQTITTAASEQTFSISAKKGTANFITINVYDGTTNNVVYFNLNTGVVGSQSNGVGSIVSLGSGWFRCSVTSTNLSASGVIELYISDTDASVTGATGNIFIYESQFENGVATDYIATTSAAVSVGPVSGLPRLDYLGSTCPRLLLEPQRSNLVTYSEQFDNAAWTKLQASITANSIVSPDGFTNADTLTADGTNNEHQLRSTGVITLSVGNTYTTSIFVKAGTNNFVQFVGSGSLYAATTYANFNVATGVVGDVGASTTASIVNYGNGWYRCSMTAAAVSTTNSNTFLFNIVTSNTAIRGESNTLSTNVYVYGATIEAGAYATSYIPTLGASVTRVVDKAEKTSASALIGQTEGTIFWEIQIDIQSASGNEQIFTIDNGSTYDNSIYLAKGETGSLVAVIVVGAVVQATFSVSKTTGTFKMAIGYANNNSAFFVDGVQVSTTDTSCSIPASLSRITLGNTPLGSTSGKTAQVLLFPTRLTNAQLAELTA